MDFKLKLKTEQENVTAEDEVQFKELQQSYRSALAALPEKQRVVFMMSRMEEMKYHEIAERLNLSVKAVEKRMKNALEFLRQALIQK